MNKYLIAACVVLTVVSGYLGCKVSQLNKTVNKLEFNPKATCTSLNYNYKGNPWPGKIDARLAKVMADNYLSDKNKSLISKNNTLTSDSDARSVWFSLESIKSYIWGIENQNCINNCKDTSLGLRIYFAKYPDETSQYWRWPGLAEVKSLYANHHTIFMIPTYHDAATNNDIDFNPWEKTSCPIPFIPGIIPPNTNPLSSSTKSLFIFYDAQTTLGVDGKNHGGLIPPNDAFGTSF